MPRAHSRSTFLGGLLLLTALVSGCITIEEHYTFKRNGSGTMEYVVDMSAFSDIADAFDSLGKKHAPNTSAELDEGAPIMGMGEKVKELRAIQGITKVKNKEEHDGYLQRIGFAFSDLDALNKALNVLMPDSSGTWTEFFRWSGNELVRTNNHYAKDLGDDMVEGVSSDEMAEVLASMTYKFSFSFRQPVVGTQLPEGMTKEAPDAKKLELSTDWRAIALDPAALDLRIAVGN